MKTKIANQLTIFIVLLFTVFGQAQKKSSYTPPSIDDEEIPVVKTELPVPEKGKDYVVKYFKGTTDGVESRIAVKKMGYIIRHAMVQVISEDGRELAIELVKKNWEDIVRSGTTKNGLYESSFKTALEFGIKISAAEIGIPFVVIISAGKELMPASNLFVDISTMQSNGENTEETGIMGQGTGQSNNTLYLIIAIALLGILALLAILVFKKKGKGAATLLLLLMTITIHAAEVKEVGPDAVESLPPGNIEEPGDHYENRGPDQDEPLNDEDKEHMPDATPPGRPSLPTSCSNIANNNKAEPSARDNNQDPAIAKNPTNDLSFEEESDSNNRKDNDANLSVEQQVENATKGLERDRRETLNSFDIGLRQQLRNYESLLRGTRKSYQEQITQAEDNPERQRSLADELVAREKELGDLNTERVEELKTMRDNNLELAIKIYNERLLEIMRQASERDREQNDSERAEKDPDRPDDKDNSDDEHQAKGPNPPSEDESGPGKSDNTEKQNKNCKCLDEPYADLQDRRNSLERLLIIGQHTKRMTDFAISFGDNFAGVHAISGLAWQTQRAKIMKSIDQFDITYNKKFEELIGKLNITMMKIDECEKKLGVENWYSQWGFMYYEFMKVRYANYK